MASTEHLLVHHSLRSQQKREAVLRPRGRWSAPGSRSNGPRSPAAGVSEKFIHDRKHADVKAQVREMIAAQAGRQARARRSPRIR